MKIPTLKITIFSNLASVMEVVHRATASGDLSDTHTTPHISTEHLPPGHWWCIKKKITFLSIFISENLAVFHIALRPSFKTFLLSIQGNIVLWRLHQNHPSPTCQVAEGARWRGLQLPNAARISQTESTDSSFHKNLMECTALGASYKHCQGI